MFGIQKVQTGAAEEEKEEAAAEKNLPFKSKMTHDASHALHTPTRKKSTNLLESASDLTRKAKILTTTLALAVHVQIHTQIRSRYGKMSLIIERSVSY